MITFYGGSGQLFRSAKVSYAHIGPSVGDLDDSQPEALSTIILSFATIEAFLNELAEMVTGDPDGAPWRPESVDAYANGWLEIERRRGSTIEKFDEACQSFSMNFHAGLPLRQSIVDLCHVRNALMHFRPEKGEITGSSIVIDKSKTYARLRSRNVLPRPNSKISNWVTQIQNRAAARWACNTASKCVLQIVSAIPGTLETDEPSFKSVQLCGVEEAFTEVQ